MKSVNDIIEDVIEAEGGYMQDDTPTNFGITQTVARAHGFNGDMRDFPKDLARSIYYDDYVVKPGFDKVYLLAPTIAAELVDTGVNASPLVAAKFLQQALNTFNTDGKLFADLVVDGQIGNATINALAAYMKARKDKAIDVLLKALNCLQGTYYIGLGNSNIKFRSFTFGWINNRVKL